MHFFIIIIFFIFVPFIIIIIIFSDLFIETQMNYERLERCSSILGNKSKLNIYISANICPTFLLLIPRTPNNLCLYLFNYLCIINRSTFAMDSNT